MIKAILICLFLIGSVRADTIVFPHFANGEGTYSSIVILNASASNRIRPGSLAVLFHASDGSPIDPRSILDLHESVTIEDEGDEIALIVTQTILPLGQLTLTTHGRESLKVGYAAVADWDDEETNSSLNGVLKFHVPGFGTASILTTDISNVNTHVLMPVRWHRNRINTGMAVVNLSEDSNDLNCSMSLDNYTGWTRIEIPEDGHVAGFVSEWFPGLPDGESEGTIHCSMKEGIFAAVGLEFDYRNSVFTTLPVARVTE